MRKKKISIKKFDDKEKKLTFEEKLELVSGFDSFGVELIKNYELFLFGDSDEWTMDNIRRSLVKIVCMAYERYGITTEYAKKERDEFLERLGLLEEKEGGAND